MKMYQNLQQKCICKDIKLSGFTFTLSGAIVAYKNILSLMKHLYSDKDWA